jgi:hypothetical protein
LRDQMILPDDPFMKGGARQWPENEGNKALEFFLNSKRIAGPGGGNGVYPAIINLMGLEPSVKLNGATAFQTGSNATHPAADGARFWVANDWIEPPGGGASSLLSGISFPLVNPSHPANLTTGDFTIAFYVYTVTTPSTNNYAILDWGGGYNYAWPSIRIHASGTAGLTWALRSATAGGSGSAPDIANFTTATTGGGVTVGAWRHIAITRSGNTFRMFIGGVLNQTVVSSFVLFHSASVISNLVMHLNFGCTGTDQRYGLPGSFCFKAYYTNIIVTNYAMWTAAFTPPARLT